MSNKTAWYNDDIMVHIATSSINCPLSNNNSLTRIIAQDTNNNFYWRDSSSFGGGPEGPTGQIGSTGPTGIIGPTGANGTGTGDVIGPNGTATRAIPSFNGTTGKLLQSSLVSLDTIGSGLIFPNSNVTNSQTSLDYYEYYTSTFDFLNTVTNTIALSSVPIKLVRIGKIVFAEIGPRINTLAQPVLGTLYTLSTIPTRFMPSNTTTLYCQVKNQGVNVMGSITVDISGVLQSNPLSSSTVITLGGYLSDNNQFGFYQLAHVSWMIQ